MDVTSGLILGIVYVAAPGPINVETIRQGVKNGFIASLAVQTGSSLGLIVYALLALFGAGMLLPGPTWQLVVAVCGMAVLFYLGITTIRDGCNLAIDMGDGLPGEASARRAFGAGVILSLASPLEILFWLSLGSRVLHDPGLDGPVFLSAFFIGCIATSLVIVLFASFWHAHLTTSAARVISWACGLALIAFGLKLGLSIGRHLMIG
jgi:threonine/homoserine/homoserine lactone efflux protein